MDRLEPRRDCKVVGLMMGLGAVVVVHDSWVLALVVVHLVRAVLSYA